MQECTRTDWSFKCDTITLKRYHFWTSTLQVHKCGTGAHLTYCKRKGMDNGRSKVHTDGNVNQNWNWFTSIKVWHLHYVCRDIYLEGATLLTQPTSAAQTHLKQAQPVTEQSDIILSITEAIKYIHKSRASSVCERRHPWTYQFHAEWRLIKNQKCRW